MTRGTRGFRETHRERGITQEKRTDARLNDLTVNHLMIFVVPMLCRIETSRVLRPVPESARLTVSVSSSATFKGPEGLYAPGGRGDLCGRP